MKRLQKFSVKLAPWLFLMGAFIAAAGCTKKMTAPREVSVQEAQGLLLNQFAVLIDLKQAGTPPTPGLPTARMVLNPAQVDSPEERQKFVQAIPEKYVLLLTGAPQAKLSELASQIFQLGRQTDWITPAADTPSAKKPAPAKK